MFLFELAILIKLWLQSQLLCSFSLVTKIQSILVKHGVNSLNFNLYPTDLIWAGCLTLGLQLPIICNLTPDSAVQFRSSSWTLTLSFSSTWWQTNISLFIFTYTLHIIYVLLLPPHLVGHLHHTKHSSEPDFYGSRVLLCCLHSPPLQYISFRWCILIEFMFELSRYDIL